jgi:hypothetical protein
MRSAEFIANRNHFFFGFIIVDFGAARSYLGIPQVIELRAAVFVLGAGDDKVAV